MSARVLMNRLMLAAFVVYTLVLVTLTHWPKLQVKGPVPRSDLYIHLGVFGLWTVLLGLSGLIGRCPRRLVIWASVFVVVDESTQPLMQRQFDLLDLVANFGGVLIGLGVMTVWWRLRGSEP